MSKNNKNITVDQYLVSGCGRCKLFNTSKCKVNFWRTQMLQLREIMLSTGLTEEIKWSIPCYTFEGKNIASIAAFKNDCRLSFFNGALLNDPHKILTASGENSQSFRFIRITDGVEVKKFASHIKEYVEESIGLLKSGKKVEFKKIEQFERPEELEHFFKRDKALKKAFDQLTPGRQRAYLIFISGAKQRETRVKRITNSIPKILNGKGPNE